MRMTVTADTRELDILPARLIAGTVKGADEGSFYLRSYLLTEHLTGGTTKTRLGVRTGRLRSKTRPIEAKVAAGKVEAGVHIGVFYASVHIGPKGQETIIRPKTKTSLRFEVEPGVWRSSKEVRVPTRVHPEEVAKKTAGPITNIIDRAVEREANR